MTTRIIPGSNAILQPAVISPVWSSVLYTRLYIYRNYIPHSKLVDPASSPAQQVRFVSVLKANGVSHHDFENGVAGKVVVVVMQIQEGGISDVELLSPLTPAPPVVKDKRLSLSQSPDASPSASPLAGRSKLPEVFFDPSPSVVRMKTLIQSPSASPSASPLPSNSDFSPKFPLPGLPRRSESPVRKKRKTGLEVGVVRGSDEEDSDDEGFSDELDNDELGVELPKLAKEMAGGFTTLGGCGVGDGE